MAELFGFTIGRKKEEKQDQQLPSIIPKNQDDGSIEIAPGGAYGTYVDLEGKAKNEGELVDKYREMATQPECDIAIQDIVNEAIVYNEKESPIKINCDELNQPENIKKAIIEEYERILEILDFNNLAYEIFRRWYVDGRLYYHILIDEKNPRKGIQDLRYVDPRKIRKVKEHIKEKDPRTGADIYKGTSEYYVYNPRGAFAQATNQGIKISPDSVAFSNSGIMDNRNNLVYSHLHKAIKPLNQLRMLEDAVVIYRLARAPERRIFYIDVGNLPKGKAEQYLRDMMVKHKNKLTYDAQTGEVRDDRRFMTMLEDFWLPRREGQRGTEISTLPGGQNLGEMEDVEYFRRKLYKSLNVPVTRLDSENQFNLGRASEITRDELKFSKFVSRLRLKFSEIFDNILEIHLSLKGIVSRKEWKEFKQYIHYDFLEDNHFTELKNSEILENRLRLLVDVEQYVGNYFSKKWVQQNVLQMTEEDIEELEKEIQDEGGNEEGDSETDAFNFEELNTSNNVIKEEVEPFVPPETMSEEEKKLVESMTRFYDSMSEKYE